MAGNTARGWPYALPADARVAWPETSRGVANKGEALEAQVEGVSARANACLPRDGSQPMSGPLHAQGGLYMQDATVPATNVADGQTRWMQYRGDGQVVRMSDGTFRFLVASIAASSARFKTGIEAADNMPDVTRLTPRTYTWTDDTWKVLAPGSRIGLIAEEVADVDPRLATVDQEGQTHGLDLPALVAALIAKVTELQTRVEQLEEG